MTQIKTITYEEVKSKYEELGSLDKMINYFRDQLPPYPSMPSKPRLTKNPNAEEARKYANEVDNFEFVMAQYRKEKEAYSAISSPLECLFTDLTKDLSGLNTSVPEQYRDKVYSYAYQRGHSSGHSEILNCLYDLVAIFE